MSQLIQHLCQWAKHGKNMKIQISERTITVEFPEEIKRVYSKWADYEKGMLRKAEAQSLGVPEADADKHKQYLAAVKQMNAAAVIRELQAASRSFQQLGSYKDSAQLVQHCRKRISELEAQEAERKCQEAERLRRVIAAYEAECAETTKSRAECISSETNRLNAAHQAAGERFPMPRAPRK